MFRSRLPRLMCALLLAQGTALFGSLALAGEVKEVEKFLRFARNSLESNRFEESESRLGEAEKNLSGLPEAELTRLRGEIAALRQEKDVKEREFNVGPLLKEFQRNIDAAEYELEQGMQGNGNSEVAQEMEPQLARAEERLTSESVTKWLSKEQIADIQTKIQDCRARGEKAGHDILVKRAEKWLAEVEEANKDLGNASWDGVRSDLENAKGSIERLPESDPRRAATLARIEMLRSAFQAGSASVERGAQVEQLEKFWAQILESYGSESEGWQNETAPTYEAFTKSMTLGMEKTLARSALVRRMTENSDYIEAKKTLTDDPKMSKLIAEVDGASNAVAQKVATLAGELLAQAEADQAKDGEMLTTALRMIESTVEHRVTPTEATTATLERTRKLIQRIADDAAAAIAAREKLTAELTAKAKELWPTLLKANEELSDGFVTLDPVAAVDNIDAWKGKTVRFANANNRAGWDYQHDDYDVILPLNGIPVGGRFDPKLWEEIQRIADATGIRFDGRLVEDVIGVVDGHCRIQGITYSQLLKEHVPTVNFKAPLLRVIAVKAGPYAISLEGGAMDLGGLSATVAAGRSDGESTQADSDDSSGFPWFTLLVLGGLGYLGFQKRDLLLALLRARREQLTKTSADELMKSARGMVDRSIAVAKRTLETKAGSAKDER